MRCCLFVVTIWLTVVAIAPAGVAQEIASVDRVAVESLRVDSATTTPQKAGFFKRFFNQLFRGNVDRTFERPIDFAYTIIPAYSLESSVGIGGVVTALYRIDRTDSIVQPSNAQLFANITFSGQYNIAVSGNNYFNRRSRLAYDVRFYNKPLDFWGISFDACAMNERIKYTRRQFRIDADYVYKISKEFHIGPSLNMSYTYISRIDSIAYLQGQAREYFLTGLGASVIYDTRDFIFNPKRGLFLMVKGMIYPHFLGTAPKSVFTTTLVANYYQPLWVGGIAAFDLYAMYSGKDTPWPLRAEMGAGNARMRGYYSGRYTDNNQMNMQVELRQQIYKRWGAVAWVGYGGVFPSLEALDCRHLFINYGFGARFEIKHNLNLRVDVGFGKDAFAVIFNVGEAF